MGRFLQELKDALRRESSDSKREATPSEPKPAEPAPTSQPAAEAVPPASEAKPAVEAEPTVPDAKPTLAGEPTVPDVKPAAGAEPTVPDTKPTGAGEPTVPDVKPVADAAPTVPDVKPAADTPKSKHATAPLPGTAKSDPDEKITLALSPDESRPTIMVKDTRATVVDLVSGRHSTAVDLVVVGFKTVPEKYEGIAPTPEKPHYRIELTFDDSTKAPLRLQVADAAVFGRGAGCHIPLDDHNAEEKGISRQHAMLRPSGRALFFFDLDSKNGSHHNGIQIGAGMATTLSLGDVIRLGSLNLTISRLEKIG